PYIPALCIRSWKSRSTLVMAWWLTVASSSRSRIPSWAPGSCATQWKTLPRSAVARPRALPPATAVRHAWREMADPRGPGSSPRISRAPDLSAADGLTPLGRASRHSLMLGLFLPLQQGAWSPSTWTRGTSWSFAYNAECAVRADELGFDLVFGLAQWMGKGGDGRGLQFPRKSTEPPLRTRRL